MGGSSERMKEIKRRRHRRKKLAQLGKSLENAKPALRAHIAEKVRKLTPGADVVLKNWGLEDV